MSNASMTQDRSKGADKPGDASSTTVELRGVSKHYGPLAVVDNVTLTVEPGQILCLLGPSGCGKTTTLRLIAGFIAPTAGEIVVGGRVLSTPQRTVVPERRNMSMIFQSYALWPHMTVADNVAYGLQMRGLDRIAIRAKLNAILATTQLSALADRYPGELSGGQQQRVALARSLIVEPQTLLLDEPLSNLDANMREDMRFEMRRLHEAYRHTTIYVTHDQIEAMTMADVIAIMNAGRIEQIGPVEEVYHKPRSEFVARFLGGSNVLKGTARDAKHVAAAGGLLRCTGDAMTPGAAAAIAIRPHEPRMTTTRPIEAENVLSATVVRQVFVGRIRDYLLATSDGTQLRVVTPAEQNLAQGTAVWLYLPPERCRVLAE